MSIGTIVAAVVFAIVHLFAAKLRFLAVVPRSRWLSAASGISVAYVFVHLLPELAEGQEAVAEAPAGPLPFLERHVYLVALVGLAIFYGLELAARQSRREQREHGEDETSAEVFWLHVASYGTYNALIGYLLSRACSIPLVRVSFRGTDLRGGRMFE